MCRKALLWEAVLLHSTQLCTTAPLHRKYSQDDTNKIKNCSGPTPQTWIGIPPPLRENFNRQPNSHSRTHSYIRVHVFFATSAPAIMVGCCVKNWKALPGNPYKFITSRLPVRLLHSAAAAVYVCRDRDNSRPLHCWTVFPVRVWEIYCELSGVDFHLR